MKRFLHILFIAFAMISLVSCTKETVLSLSQTSFSFDKNGGNTSIVVSANKLWTASSNQGWCKVSPSSGDGSKQFDSSVSLSCEANTTSESRTCTITFTSEDKIATVSVTQSEGDAIILSRTEYDLSSAAQTIIVTVQHNVNYEIEIPDACKGWISVAETKALSSQGYQLSIAENDTYEKREGSVTFKQVNGSLRGKITIRQAQNDALMLETTQYELSPEAQQLDIKVKSNVEYSVQIDAEAQSWISLIETKALNESTLTFSVALNDGDDRTGIIHLTSDNVTTEITVKQKGEDYVVFEWSDFERYCVREFDLNGDGRISFKEALEVTEMHYSMRPYYGEDASFKGIECFKNLNALYLQYSTIYNLDLSQNHSLTTFYCSDTPITNLTLNDELESIDISYCSWPDFDISNCSALTHLNCSHNGLTSLDLTNNTKLTYLDCSNNQLTSLDLSKNAQLSSLFFNENPLVSIDASNTLITELTLSGKYGETVNMDFVCLRNCPSLETIERNSSYNHDQTLSTLIVSDCPALKTINCSYLSLTKLELSNCPSLELLNVSHNNLTSIDVSAFPLCIVDWYSNPLTSLNYSNNTALTGWVWTRSERLENLDLSNCPNVASFTMERGTIGTVNLSGCKSLTSLPINSIRNVDNLIVSNCTSLTTVDLTWSSRIKSLNLSDCPALETVILNANTMEVLNLSNCSSLVYLFSNSNFLERLDLDGCFSLLELNINSNSDTELTSLDVSQCSALAELRCGSAQLKSLDVSKNPELKVLSCVDNQLTSLDVSNNPILEDLFCKNNQLASLNVSKNPDLKFLNCSNNQLTSLNVSKNSLLQTLDCSSNQLTTLDVSNNTELNTLKTKENPALSEIWLKTGQEIASFSYDYSITTIKYKD